MPFSPVASTRLSAVSGVVPGARRGVFARRIVVMCAMLAGAGFVQSTLAQTPRPIDPTTSVKGTPLVDNPASGVTAPSAASAAAESTAQTNSFDARQKALNVRTEENDYRYGVQQHDCYSKFFVDNCLKRALAARRVVSQQIRAEQLALDDEQRLQHAQQRDQQTALKRAQYEADAPQRAANEKASEESYAQKQQQNALSEAQRKAEAPQRAQNQAAYDRKQADYQKKLADAAAQGAQDARNRELKAERFEAKQRDAALHQADVAARQKEAAAKQQQHAQQAEADQKHQEELKQQQEQQKQPK